jgi:hypothetical protein
MANSYINKFNYDNSNISPIFETLCLSCYWAEGSKFRKRIELTNSDPKMLEMFSIFLLNVCNVEKEKLKGRLQIHRGNNVDLAKTFWSYTCNIQESEIIVTVKETIKSSKTNKHPYGIFSVIYNSVGLKSLLDEKILNLKREPFNV